MDLQNKLTQKQTAKSQPITINVIVSCCRSCGHYVENTRTRL